MSLRQMLDHCREALALVADRSREDLDRDRVFALALCRLVEIVGEAANRVSQGCCEKHAEVPWRQLIGLRNRLIHGYDAIDHDMLWQILTADFQPLTTMLGKIADAGDTSSP